MSAVEYGQSVAHIVGMSESGHRSCKCGAVYDRKIPQKTASLNLLCASSRMAERDLISKIKFSLVHARGEAEKRKRMYSCTFNLETGEKELET